MKTEMCVIWGSALRHPVVESTRTHFKVNSVVKTCQKSRLRKSSLTSGNSWSKKRPLNQIKESHPCPLFFPLHGPTQRVASGRWLQQKCCTPPPVPFCPARPGQLPALPVTHTLYGSRGSDVNVILKDTFDLRERTRRHYGQVRPQS